MPVFTSALPSRSVVALALCALVLVSGCDTQPQPAPQANEGGGGGNARYRIDRSHAGTALPQLAAAGPDGAPRTFASLAGKPALVNLWATWCAPCIEELPGLNAVALANGARAHVIAISQDIGTVQTPRDFLVQRDWTALSLWHDPENTIGLAYGGGLPVTILFNAGGAETARVIGPMDWSGEEARALLREAGLDAG